jgi:hypothetical protein
MSLLDRFRSRPPWEDPNPETRLQAVRQLPTAEQPLLEAIARSDGEAAVRRAAVRKLDDPAVLQDLMNSDVEESVRDEVAQSLLRVVLAGEDDPAQSALSALSQPRHLAAVAREAASQASRRAALTRLGDARSLLSVAKAAVDADTRLEALSRIEDSEALIDVASNAEHRDVGMAALERIVDVEGLRRVAARARHKSASRRARARLEELTGAPQPVTPEERRAADLALVRRVEALEGRLDHEPVEIELSLARQDWTRLAGHDVQLAERFESVCGPIEVRLARHRQVREAQRRLSEAASEALDARAALCERLEMLEGSAALDGLASVSAEWDALAPIPSPAAEPAAQDLSTAVSAVEDRYARALAGCRERHQATLNAGQRSAKLTALCAELERLFEADESVGLKALREEARSLVASPGIDARLCERHDVIEGRWAEQQAQDRAERGKKTDAARARAQKIIAKLEALAAKEKPALAPARAALRECRSVLDAAEELSRADHDALMPRLRRARTALYPKVQELNEAEEWTRWSNAAAQEELCKRVESLRERKDLEAVARELHEIRERWKVVATAPRAEADALWQRFKTARDAVQASVDAFFAKRNEEYAENLRQKETLCERAEELQGSTDWAKAAESFKTLQAEWKATGPVARRHSQALWQRFRKACDLFFEARQADLERRKDEWGRNLEAKQALIERAVALAESTDWDTAAAELKSLQAEWKTIGPVRRNKADAIWQRFRAACNVFFERYKRRDEISQDADLEQRVGLCEELEAVCVTPAATEPPPESIAESSAEGTGATQEPAGLAERVAQIHELWRSLGPAPALKRAQMQTRYQRARHRLVENFPRAFTGTELDPAAAQARMEKLCVRAERLAKSRTNRSAGDLASQLREALAANTLGGGGERGAASMDELKSIKSAWSRLGPVPGAEGDALRKRFQEACRRLEE